MSFHRNCKKSIVVTKKETFVLKREVFAYCENKQTTYYLALTKKKRE